MLGIVRMSGPTAIGVAGRMTALDDGSRLADRPGSTRSEGDVFIDADLSLPATLYLFRAPRSYTRQDLVEVHTIGSPPVLELIRRRAVELGARPAEPGEFTARAFLNGAMDLASAEAVAGIIRAQTDTQLRASRGMMDGALAGRIAGVRDELAEVLALVEADIDFAEEPIEFITPAALHRRLAALKNSLADMLNSAVSAERFDALPHILLFGPPNVGKSSLMNRLSGTPRSICAAAAGTTRDILSAPIRIGRGEAILLDTAGVDRSDDEIIAAARAMVFSAAERVDLVCVVVDGSDPNDEHLFDVVRSLSVDKTIVVANKTDLLDVGEAENVRRRVEAHGLGPVCLVSALTGGGLDELRAVLAECVATDSTTTLGDSILISERQGRAIHEAAEALGRAIGLSASVRETVDCADVLAFELREALEALGTVTGTVTTEDLLSQVFARFCIGK